jgi:glutamine cyclotransferase
VLWESTGIEGESLVRALDKSGGVLWSYPNPDGFFNEGLVHAFDKTYLLTYKEGKAYLFDPNAEQPYTDFATDEGQGWGPPSATSRRLQRQLPPHCRPALAIIKEMKWTTTAGW